MVSFLPVGRMLLVAAVLVVVAPFASAHGLTILCQPAGGELVVRVGFGRTAATPVEAASVTVKDATDTVIAEGRTDSNGELRIPKPPAGTYTMAADGEDHAASIQVTIAASDADVANADVANADVANADVATVAAPRERPSAWPVLAVVAVLILVIGIWRYRPNPSASRPNPPETA